MASANGLRAAAFAATSTLTQKSLFELAEKRYIKAAQAYKMSGSKYEEGLAATSSLAAGGEAYMEAFKMKKIAEEPPPTSPPSAPSPPFSAAPPIYPPWAAKAIFVLPNRRIFPYSLAAVKNHRRPTPAPLAMRRLQPPAAFRVLPAVAADSAPASRSPLHDQSDYFSNDARMPAKARGASSSSALHADAFLLLVLAAPVRTRVVSRGESPHDVRGAGAWEELGCWEVSRTSAPSLLLLQKSFTPGPLQAHVLAQHLVLDPAVPVFIKSRASSWSLCSRPLAGALFVLSADPAGYRQTSHMSFAGELYKQYQHAPSTRSAFTCPGTSANFSLPYSSSVLLTRHSLYPPPPPEQGAQRVSAALRRAPSVYAWVCRNLRRPSVRRHNLGLPFGRSDTGIYCSSRAYFYGRSFQQSSGVVRDDPFDGSTLTTDAGRARPFLYIFTFRIAKGPHSSHFQ
ncbi:hypothetical protein C8R43DRAFT_1130775 [Mycena crocata]|nr:hypothetical protein C8R43DRAFT_1130775 [Mycena crocata]